MAKKQKGVIEFKAEGETEIVNKLITELDPSVVEKEVPGLPAHLIFMAIRYIDILNEERRMQSLLSNAINGIRKTVKVSNYLQLLYIDLK